MGCENGILFLRGPQGAEMVVCDRQVAEGSPLGGQWNLATATGLDVGRSFDLGDRHEIFAQGYKTDFRAQGSGQCSPLRVSPWQAGS